LQLANHEDYKPETCPIQVRGSIVLDKTQADFLPHVLCLWYTLLQK
jgi:hypothetical protein